MKIISQNKQYSIVDINVDDLAAQLTLIDLPIFKSIKREELINLGQSSHRSARRQDLCPNIVAMNRQFNQVTFWVVGQILSHESARMRTDLISHFIKTAKRLHQLNNLHSTYAIVSALLSSPIYRLKGTWHLVRKKCPKEKYQLDKLRHTYSDNNNYELLRNHLATCNLPCIPYLGIYSRDIIYINEAHQEGTIQRSKSTSKILESIETFQKSEYEDLTHIPYITRYLLSNRYIDELQKFVEDENYRRSLELEPPAKTIMDQTSTDNHHKKPAMLLASFTSMVQLAFVTTSNKFGSSPLRGSSAELQKSNKYLIDDSYIHQKNLIVAQDQINHPAQ